MDIFSNDLYVRNNLKVGGKLLVGEIPTQCVEDESVKDDANIAASKLEHQHSINFNTADGVDVAAVIMPIYLTRGAAATIEAIQATCIDAPTGGDNGFTVDLKIANVGAPAPVTVLTGLLTFVNDTTADCEVVEGVIASSDLTVGDTLLVVVALTGSTGALGQGLVVTVTIREMAD